MRPSSPSKSADKSVVGYSRTIWSRTRWSLHWHSRSSNCFCWSWTNSRKKKSRIQAIMCRGNIFDRSGLLRSHVTFPANSVQVVVFISVWLTLVVNKYFCVSQCVHAWQIENLAETNFVEIFGRATQILSVQCVRTLTCESRVYLESNCSAARMAGENKRLAKHIIHDYLILDI